MKTSTYKLALTITILLFLVACSTKKNNFVSRNSHALTTKYNVLYNGGIALDKGILDLKSQYKDNFWETLPVERMQVVEQTVSETETKNTNFERAEAKATKAIQKHSMNIDGSEKNPQMDEAHLLLGKTRYYDQRFVPALEAFNYVLYKYPKSDKIYEVKIWREKTNMRMDNDALAIINLRKLLKEIKFKDQIFADANATLAQAFLNLKEKDSAIAKLKIALDFTKQNEEKGNKDSAFAAYQEVIDMKRKSSRQYVIQAHAKQAQQFDYEEGDTLAFIEKYNDLLNDRENRPHLDVLNYQMGLFYDKNSKLDYAKKYYNASLKAKSQDDYLVASTYRNLAEINFTKAKYVTAGNYYDSTLVYLKERTREYKLISKKRENLEDAIKFEGIAQRNDSILKVTSLSSSEKENYYKEHIDKLKIEEEKTKALLDKQQKEKQDNAVDGDAKAIDKATDTGKKQVIPNIPVANTTLPKTGDFYFYNPTTVAYGKAEFAKNWGKRAFGPNWRLSSIQEKGDSKTDDTVNEEDLDNKEIKVEERFTTNFYLKQLPTSQVALDSIARERNFAYYQLGVIYKEKFKEYKRASNKLETLLDNNPEERLVLPAMYNLFKIYEIINPSKALKMKSEIVSKYPDSRYAQILNNDKVNLELGSPEVVYKNLYKDFENGIFRETINKTDMAIVQFTGEEMLPKYELLKANLIGKLYGLKEYKKSLNFVALTYPNTQEGKETEMFIATKVPLLDALYFNGEPASSYKIIYATANSLDEKSNKPLLDKLTKFAKERTIEKLTISTDVYTNDRNLIVIHGIKTEENAKGIAQVLKEFKDYKILEPSIVIASENYKIVQIFKNLEEYTSGTGPTFDAKEKPVIVLPTPKAEKLKIEKPTRESIKTEEYNLPGKADGRNGEQPNTGNNSKDSKKNMESNDDAMPNMMPPAPNVPKR